MKVVDSCIWLELLSRGPLVEVARAVLVDPGEIVVPTMVVLEVYKWMYRERGETSAGAVVARMMLSRITPLDARVAIRAGRLCKDHGMATADATIYAHAEMEGLPLVTCDEHFKGLPGVEYHVRPRTSPPR